MLYHISINKYLSPCAWVHSKAIAVFTAMGFHLKSTSPLLEKQLRLLGLLTEPKSFTYHSSHYRFVNRAILKDEAKNPSLGVLFEFKLLFIY